MKMIAFIFLSTLISGSAYGECAQKAESVIRSLFAIDHPSEKIKTVSATQQTPKTTYEIEVSSLIEADHWPAHWVYQIAFERGVCRVKTLEFIEVYH